MQFIWLKKRSPNTIDAGTTITGNIQSENNWTVSGTLFGDLIVIGDVIIEEKAEIRGNISGQNVRIAGKVTGNIEAKKMLHICSTSSIEGDISYQTLRIEKGACISGKMTQADFAMVQAETIEAPEKTEPAMQKQYIIQPVEETAFPIRNKRVIIQ